MEKVGQWIPRSVREVVLVAEKQTGPESEAAEPVRVSDRLKTRDPKDSIKAIAMNIGKNVACYIETMYPEAVQAASSTFLLSLRNDIYNEIMEAVTSKRDMQETLERHKKFRRAQRAAYKRIRAVRQAGPGKTRE